MEIEWVRKYCLSLPHTTEQVQWGSDLLFKVGGKMYALLPLEPARIWLTFKCTDQDFTALLDQPGIIPAPYLARAKWVAIETERALRPTEIRQLLRQSYDLVLAKLPKKTRETLGSVRPKAAAKRKARPQHGGAN